MQEIIVKFKENFKEFDFQSIFTFQCLPGTDI